MAADEPHLSQQPTPAIMDIPTEPDQIAVLGFGSRDGARQTLGGGKLMMIDELMRVIHGDLAEKSYRNAAISEQYLLLRTLQFAANCWFGAPKTRPKTRSTHGKGST